MINDIATYVSYMGGYHKDVCKYHTFCTWYRQYQDAKRNGTLESLFECKKTNSRLPYTQYLDLKFPGFLHECYWYSTSIAGNGANYETIIYLMNEYARSNFPKCPIC
jgi:hypothetical protein